MTFRSDVMATEPDREWGCKECHWIGRQSTMLVGTHPFLPNEQVLGCPTCKSIDSFWEVCDEPGCRQEATCGWPTVVNYRRTCGHHYDPAKRITREAIAERKGCVK
jgi:hypothetical protein